MLSSASLGGALLVGILGWWMFHSTNQLADELNEESKNSGKSAGEYSDVTKAFPKAIAATFDGIVIDKNTRLIIYEKPNFKGDTLLDETGPMVINNVDYKSSYPYTNWLNQDFRGDLNEKFPPETRKWSKTNMHSWNNGSVEIICD